jgi:hypothetical protein
MLAEALFVLRPCVLPQAIEHRLAFGVESLHGQDRDVAMLRVNPSERRARGAPHGQSHQNAQAQEEFLWHPFSPPADGALFIGLL